MEITITTHFVDCFLFVVVVVLVQQELDDQINQKELKCGHKKNIIKTIYINLALSFDLSVCALLLSTTTTAIARIHSKYEDNTGVVDSLLLLLLLLLLPLSLQFGFIFVIIHNRNTPKNTADAAAAAITTLTTTEKLQLLNAHNLLRSETASGMTPNQPSAANMNELFWDPVLVSERVLCFITINLHSTTHSHSHSHAHTTSLSRALFFSQTVLTFKASVASDYAAECVWGHNPHRATNVYAMRSSATFTMDSAYVAIGENIWLKSGVITDDRHTLLNHVLNGVQSLHNEYQYGSEFFYPL